MKTKIYINHKKEIATEAKQLRDKGYNWEQIAKQLYDNGWVDLNENDIDGSTIAKLVIKFFPEIRTRPHNKTKRTIKRKEKFDNNIFEEIITSNLSQKLKVEFIKRLF